MKKKDNDFITFRSDKLFKEELKRICKTTGQSKSRFIRTAVIEKIMKIDKKGL